MSNVSELPHFLVGFRYSVNSNVEDMTEWESKKQNKSATKVLTVK